MGLSKSYEPLWRRSLIEINGHWPQKPGRVRRAMTNRAMCADIRRPDSPSVQQIDMMPQHQERGLRGAKEV